MRMRHGTIASDWSLRCQRQRCSDPEAHRTPIQLSRAESEEQRRAERARRLASIDAPLCEHAFWDDRPNCIRWDRGCAVFACLLRCACRLRALQGRLLLLCPLCCCGWRGSAGLLADSVANGKGRAEQHGARRHQRSKSMRSISATAAAPAVSAPASLDHHGNARCASHGLRTWAPCGRTRPLSSRWQSEPRCSAVQRLICVLAVHSTLQPSPRLGSAMCSVAVLLSGSGLCPLAARRTPSAAPTAQRHKRGADRSTSESNHAHTLATPVQRTATADNVAASSSSSASISTSAASVCVVLFIPRTLRLRT